MKLPKIVQTRGVVGVTDSKKEKARKEKHVSNTGIVSKLGEAVPSKKKSNILGFGFMSPATLFVVVSATAGLRGMVVNDETTRSEAKSFMLGDSRDRRVMVVKGIRNLKKLGKIKRLDVSVVVSDSPDLIQALDTYITIVDADHNEKTDHWKVAEAMDIPTLGARIKESSYKKPIHPIKVRAAIASAHPTIPEIHSTFAPGEALDTVFEFVSPDYREQLQTKVYRYLAGLQGKQQAAGARRASATRLRPGTPPERFQSAFDELMLWISDPERGRSVAKAYQLIAKSKEVIQPPVAAARVNADLQVLMKLIRFIPPSRRQVFEGYDYNPKQGD